MHLLYVLTLLGGTKPGRDFFLTELMEGTDNPGNIFVNINIMNFKLLSPYIIMKIVSIKFTFVPPIN